MGGVREHLRRLTKEVRTVNGVLVVLLMVVVVAACIGAVFPAIEGPDSLCYADYITNIPEWILSWLEWLQNMIPGWDWWDW
jgi:predicted PurR-regulated permease PerM